MNQRASVLDFAPAQSLTDRAYADIEEMIVTLQARAGQRGLRVGALAAHLGIGRTPIREALQRLARERLVVDPAAPRHHRLRHQRRRSQLRLLEVRRELERLIARSAARRATDDERDALPRARRGASRRAAKANDDVTFMRIDRDFNVALLGRRRTTSSPPAR